jgi:hypothetical protein
MSYQPTNRNLDALLLGTGEFRFSPNATSVADAESKGYQDFGNIQATGLAPTLEKIEHEGSYRGKKIVDKRIGTKGVIEYKLKCDEFDRKKLVIALMGTEVASPIIQASLTLQAADTWSFSATNAVPGRWYPIKHDAAEVREVTAISINKVAASVSCTVSDTTDKITSNSHGLSNGAPVRFSADVMPTGLTANQTYYVISAATNDFKVAATIGGTAIDIGSAGTTVVYMPLLVEETDYWVDYKTGCVRFAAAQTADKIAYISCSAITSSDAASLVGIDPLSNLIISGFGRILIFDDNHPNKLIYDHKDFSCDLSFESVSEADGKAIGEVTINVLVTATEGDVWIAED